MNAILNHTCSLCDIGVQSSTKVLVNAITPSGQHAQLVLSADAYSRLMNAVQTDMLIANQAKAARAFKLHRLQRRLLVRSL